MKAMTKKITPFLWFDNQLEEAMAFYTSIFPNSKITDVTRMEEADPNGNTVTVGSFELDGVEFAGMNAGPEFKFNEAISLYVECADQAETDYYWNALTADGGEESYCGWLKDKFGLSWQVAPRRLNELVADPDPARAKRALQAMLKMQKIDIAEIERAANGQ